MELTYVAQNNNHEKIGETGDAEMLNETYYVPRISANTSAHSDKKLGNDSSTTKRINT